MSEYQTIFSPCRQYRYTLWRELPMQSALGDPAYNNQGYVQFIGLNPSTADETKNDPTIRRCIDFTRRWGWARMCMTNLFAYRATDPKVMLAMTDPRGPENLLWIDRIARGAALIVCAWGTDGKHHAQNRAVIETLQAALVWHKVCHLGRNADGSPKHPLYLKANLSPQPFAT